MVACGSPKWWRDVPCSERIASCGGRRCRVSSRKASREAVSFFSAFVADARISGRSRCIQKTRIALMVDVRFRGREYRFCEDLHRWHLWLKERPESAKFPAGRSARA